MVGVVNTPELQVGDMAWPRTAAYDTPLPRLLPAVLVVVLLLCWLVLTCCSPLHEVGVAVVLAILF
jgi:hypothetical protein